MVVLQEVLLDSINCSKEASHVKTFFDPSSSLDQNRFSKKSIFAPLKCLVGGSKVVFRRMNSFICGSKALVNCINAS